MRTKTYVNGNPYNLGEMKTAREILIREGIYRTLGNMGPYLPGKDDIQHQVLRTFVIDGFEFTLVEYECMSMGWDFQISEPHKEKAIWFQTC